MFQKRLPTVDGEHGVNLTPLIDVSLVLVVILLLATPLAFQSNIGLRNARSTGRESDTDAKLDRVELRLISADSLLVNERPIARADFGAVLAPLMAHSARRQVVVHCEDAVPHGVFVGVLDEAKLCGAVEIAMVGR